MVTTINFKTKPGKWNEFMQFPDALSRDNTMHDLLNYELNYVEII